MSWRFMKSRRWWHLELGGALFLLGEQIVKPIGILETALAAINKYLDLQLDSSPPRGFGVFFIVLGLLVVCVGEFLRRGAWARRKLLAFRHHTLDALSSRLGPGNLPTGLAAAELCLVDCDEPADQGLAAAKSALGIQLEKLTELNMLRRTFPEAEIGYFGTAHVPLQFLAGTLLSTFAVARLFELERQSGKWRELKAYGPNLHVAVVKGAKNGDRAPVAIRIPISYEISTVDVGDVLGAFEDIRLGPVTPHLDSIRSYDQVKRISQLFRELVDELHSRPQRPESIHVFYSGPSSLGFSLGRMISKTVHERVFVYNYSPGGWPRYSWRVEVTTGSIEEVIPANPGRADVSR